MRFVSIPVIVLLCGAGWLGGCVSKPRARREAQMAFWAGQNEGPERARRAATTLQVRGLVRNPLVTWRPEMTLSGALLEAGYQGRTDPHRITLTRQGVAYPIDLRRLLRGLDDPAVFPGDLIDLQ